MLTGPLHVRYTGQDTAVLGSHLHRIDLSYLESSTTAVSCSYNSYNSTVSTNSFRVSMSK